MGKPRASRKVATRSATPKKAADALVGLINEIISNLLEGKAPTEKRLKKLLGELASGTFCLIPIESRTVTKVVTRVRDRIVREIVPAFHVSAAPRPALQEIDCKLTIMEQYGIPGMPAKTLFFAGKMMVPKDVAGRSVQQVIAVWPGDKWVDGLPPKQVHGPAHDEYLVAPPPGYVCKRIVPQPYTGGQLSDVQASGPILRPPPPPLPPPSPPPGFVQVIAPGAGGTVTPGGMIPITRGPGELGFALRYTPPERRRR